MLSTLVETKVASGLSNYPLRKEWENCIEKRIAKRWLTILSYHGMSHWDLWPKAFGRSNILHKPGNLFPFLAPTASPCVQHAKEVCPCRAERQAAHPEAFWTCAHGGSKESCPDPVPGRHRGWLFSASLTTGTPAFRLGSLGIPRVAMGGVLCSKNSLIPDKF